MQDKTSTENQIILTLKLMVLIPLNFLKSEIGTIGGLHNGRLLSLCEMEVFEDLSC